MLRVITTRLSQGYHTFPFPRATPSLPPRFRGLPVLHPERCLDHCQACVEACPTEAISMDQGSLTIDLGRCIFCMDCVELCPWEAIQLSADYRIAVHRREDLLYKGGELRLAEALETQALRVFGRSLKLRQVSAGGCNGCEADVNVLTTIGFDLGRFGIQFVASPRHADGLLITGTVPPAMQQALQKTYEAVPEPKIVIAVGACAISGGIFEKAGKDQIGIPNAIPVDLFVPGCPPHPYTILDGLLRLLGKFEGH